MIAIDPQWESSESTIRLESNDKGQVRVKIDYSLGLPADGRRLLLLRTALGVLAKEEARISSLSEEDAERELERLIRIENRLTEVHNG